ncbi:YcjF family protein [Phormidesmis sp. 146-12]
MTERTKETKSALQKTEASPKSEPSWVDTTRDLIGGAFSTIGKALPVQQVSDTVIGWFSVDEAEIAGILQKVRSELPTTEAILVGKPQAGKSSIVRGLTGVSAEIIGQGFRPHTRFTQRYNYPTDDLPLLVFTDTVGLGDGTQETTEVIGELVEEIQENEETRAKVLILTVKITDFATDTLKQIAGRIRQQHPEVPCLLVVTCLHELYPSEVMDHPTYPPDYEDTNRAFAALQKGFQGLFDRAIQIDFTLEEDGFTPTFYGLETLVDALADLLPEAEARTISQLLDDRDAGKQISDIYREAGRRYILPFSVMAGALAAIPLPLATMPVLTALQVSMVGALGQLYGQTLTPSQAGGVVSAIAGGFVAQAIGRELIKFIPGFGSVIAASWATAYTWSLGETACVYFGDLMGGKKPDPRRIQSVMKESFEAAKERFQSAKK